MTTDTYVALLTSEHRSQPLYAAAVRAMVQGFSDGYDTLQALLDLYNIDYAVGDQLDTIARWVGVIRAVPVPLTNVYFTWGGTVQTGWGVGVWKGPTDPGTGIVTLGDSDFRTLIRAKIMANSWDGSADGLRDIFTALFGTGVSFVDTQNQSYNVKYKTTGLDALSAVMQTLLINDFLAVRPSGISVTYTAI